MDEEIREDVKMWTSFQKKKEREKRERKEAEKRNFRDRERRRCDRVSLSSYSYGTGDT